MDRYFSILLSSFENVYFALDDIFSRHCYEIFLCSALALRELWKEADFLIEETFYFGFKISFEWLETLLFIKFLNYFEILIGYFQYLKKEI